MAYFDSLTRLEIIWVSVGLAGQLLFSLRFLVQWVSSERRGRSVMPVAFWYFSLAGGVVLLSYALYRQDPVFVIGQFAGLFIYTRNLMLINRHKRVEDASVGG